MHLEDERSAQQASKQATTFRARHKIKNEKCESITGRKRFARARNEKYEYLPVVEDVGCSEFVDIQVRWSLPREPPSTETQFNPSSSHRKPIRPHRKHHLSTSANRISTHLLPEDRFNNSSCLRSEPCSALRATPPPSMIRRIDRFSGVISNEINGAPKLTSDRSLATEEDSSKSNHACISTVASVCMTMFEIAIAANARRHGLEQQSPLSSPFL